MTIDEAIERLEFNWSHYPQLRDTPFAKAEKLGIEALEWLRQWRGTNSTLANVRLPGETKD